MKRTVLSLLAVLWISSPILAQTNVNKSSDIGEQKEALLKLTDKITAAKIKRDVPTLERILDDDFVFTNPAGPFANKTEYLDGARADTATYESVANYDQVVRIYGDAAVVAGITTVKGRYDGQEIGGRFRFTNMFVKREDKWQCIATHLTRIARE
jgi:ketosteroid isomerase-like protein